MSVRNINCIIEDIGVGFYHPSSFKVDRPRGLGSFLFLHFLTPACVLTRDGTINVSPGECLLYGPRDPQWYRGNSEEFGNNWFHAEPKIFSPLARKYGLPTNTIISPGRTDFITPLMTEISHEILHKRSSYERMAELLVEKLFLELTRHLKEKSDLSLTPRKLELLRKFRELRFKIHKDFQRRWTVHSMAQIACLSPSRFTALYKEFFNVSPVDDLINVRIERAKWLLSNSHLSVADACEQSGFENIYYFSRLFKRRAGAPPSKYAGRIFISSNLDKNAIG